MLAAGIICIATLFIADMLYGAEGAAHGSEWKEWLWRILNFAILVVILVKFAGKPLREFLKKRTEMIEKTLREAEEAKNLAAQSLAAVNERLKLKDREIEEIIANAQTAARKEKELLIQQGEQMSGRILEQARNNIDYEVRLAREKIREEVAEIALELAERKMREKLSREKQIELIEESLARMEEKK